MPKMGYGQFDIVRVNAGGGHYLLLPVLTTTQRDALSAETGMAIYNSTTGYVENYDGSNWVAVAKAYGDATFLKLAGGTMTGTIAMGNNKITGLAAPTAANDAARKTYVDTLAALYLPLAGGTMSGAIAMGTKKITGMGDPTAAQDAATKTYVDGAIDADIATHAGDYGLHTKVIRKTADETVNDSTTYQDDDELVLAVAANEVWTFKIFVRQNTSTSADIKYANSGPAGSTIVFWLKYSGSSASGAATAVAGQGTGADTLEVIEGIIVNGATAGNLTLRWAQNSKEATDTKVLANSCIVATKIA